MVDCAAPLRRDVTWLKTAGRWRPNNRSGCHTASRTIHPQEFPPCHRPSKPPFPALELSSAQAQCLPFSRQDVEQGFRAQASRLRVQAERIAMRHRVSWSLRVMRGTLADAAVSLHDQSDLLLLVG